MTSTPDIDGVNLSRHPVVVGDMQRIVAADLPWHRLDGATVVVAGANGFLPAYMVEVLLALRDLRGIRCEVVALVRSPERAARRFAAWRGDARLSLIKQDIAAPTWDGTADVIIHAASQASPKHYGLDPVGTALPNVIGTAQLLDLAKRRHCKQFLYFSSSEVYGALESGVVAREDRFAGIDPATVRASYAESKRLGETLCVAYASQHSVPAVIVRPFHTYGPGLRLDDGRVFADFVRDVVEGRDIVLHSAGLAERAFCYLSDATEGFFAALLNGKPGTAYNVANPDAALSIRDLATLIAGLYPERQISARFAPDVPSGYIASAVQRVMPDIARMRELGWQPRIGLAEGFRRTIDVYLSTAHQDPTDQRAIA